MKINKIEWAKCPNCGTLLNDYGCYPLNILFTGSSDCWFKHKCTKCSKEILVQAIINLTFKAEETDVK